MSHMGHVCQHMKVYGDYIHQNGDSTHLDGGIKDAAVWQEQCWQKLVALPSPCYNAPGGAVDDGLCSC